MTKIQPQRTPLVLIADDDRSTRIILRLLLQREGYEVVEVVNGELCLVVFAERKPDMVLLDAQMPVMDGFDCCERLKKLPFGDRVPILMITGLEDSESVNRAFQSGAADFIAKPINALILSRRLRYLLKTSQAEAAIRESEERYRTLVENLKEVIFQTDLEGKLTFLNPAWESITGFSLKNFIGKKFFSFLCPESSQPIWKQLKQVLQGKLPEYRDEVRFINQHGGFGWMELYACPLLSQGGEIIGISGSLNDVTERKDREFVDQLERSTIQVLAESETLEIAIPTLLNVMGQIMEWDYSEFWIENPQTQNIERLQNWYTSVDEHRSHYEEFPPFNPEYIQACWDKHAVSVTLQPFETPELSDSSAEVQSEIQSAFSFPIAVGYECLGMVVFLKEFHSKIDANLLDRLRSIGGQIGAFMLRKTAEKKLQKHHDLMRSELDQAAHYIRTLLPKPLEGATCIDHFFYAF
jgi:phosphoserine phosphatase RsbU/P